MSKSYHITAKKAIAILISAFFLFYSDMAYAKVSTDPGYPLQTLFFNQINAPKAWDHTVGSTNVVVAIIDTGADTWHDDLRDNIWNNVDEVPSNGIDDDNNGYVDDVNGWNFVDNDNNIRTSVFGENDDSKAVHHGTILAGLIGASGDNGIAGAGVAWKVKLMILKAMDNVGSGGYNDVARAVDYAVDNGADVINMSFTGNGFGADLHDSLRAAYEKGVVIVAAAGNDRRVSNGDVDEEPRYPVCYDQNSSENWILGVSSVDANDKLSIFADYGSCIDLVAPGEGIFSTERYSPQYGYLDEFGGPWQGTSFSSPLVAGAAALVKSIRPEWGASEIIKNLTDNSDQIDKLNPDYIGKLGRGRLNLGNAILAAYNSAPAYLQPTHLYSFEGNRIVDYDIKSESSSVVASIPNATIKGISAGIGHKLIALVQRGPSYYVQIFRNNGVFIKEFFIGIAGKRKPEVKDIQSLLRGDGLLSIIARQFDSSKNTTKLIQYDLMGNKIREVSMRGDIVKWVAKDNGLLILTLQKKKMQINALDWTGAKINSWSASGITNVFDMQAGPFWRTDGEQAVALYSKGGAVWRTIVDLPTQSWADERVGNAANSMKWKIIMTPARSGRAGALLFYNGNGGSFEFIDGSGVVGSMQAPALGNAVGYAASFN